jgi:hypothetical protein
MPRADNAPPVQGSYIELLRIVANPEVIVKRGSRHRATFGEILTRCAGPLSSKSPSLKGATNASRCYAQVPGIPLARIYAVAQWSSVRFHIA